jgi:SAM-dependent methyltransferase
VLWWYLAREMPQYGAKQLLHFAPEPPLRKRLTSAGFGSYVTADYVAARADLQLDLENLELANASYDVVLCSHVLEHVRDDARAIRELRRVCKPGGLALIQVPLEREGATREDLSDLPREERRRRFGEFDHWRVYGLDVEQRLASAGFSVEVYEVSKTIARAEQDKLGLDPGEILFVCRA